ncbi:MAG: glycosyltransferase involved in cell wall biosynthesis [Flavobacteriales bacterium]|jgi:glycosyltransferase involved in cell wall biosynthesis
MKVSIITIAYNSAETIRDTIKSVLAQDYPNLEYIVVDGGSKDNTMEIVNAHKQGISKVISEPDKGIYDAMNKGVKLASGDVIGILNSDDFYSDNCVISDIVAKFAESNADAIYADLTYVDRNNTDKVIRYWKAGSYKTGQFLKGWMPPHPTFFLKSEIYEKHGIYSTELKSAADYELMLRMIHKHQIKVDYLPRVITLMREGGESNVSLKNRIRANKEDRQAWKMNGLKAHPLTLFRKPLSKLSQFIKK